MRVTIGHRDDARLAGRRRGRDTVLVETPGSTRWVATGGRGTRHAGDRLPRTGRQSRTGAPRSTVARARSPRTPTSSCPRPAERHAAHRRCLTARPRLRVTCRSSSAAPSSTRRSLPPAGATSRSMHACGRGDPRRLFENATRRHEHEISSRLTTRRTDAIRRRAHDALAEVLGGVQQVRPARSPPHDVRGRARSGNRALPAAHASSGAAAATASVGAEEKFRDVVDGREDVSDLVDRTFHVRDQVDEHAATSLRWGRRRIQRSCCRSRCCSGASRSNSGSRPRSPLCRFSRRSSTRPA